MILSFRQFLEENEDLEKKGEKDLYAAADDELGTLGQIGTQVINRWLDIFSDGIIRFGASFSVENNDDDNDDDEVRLKPLDTPAMKCVERIEDGYRRLKKCQPIPDKIITISKDQWADLVNNDFKQNQGGGDMMGGGMPGMGMPGLPGMM